MNAYRNPELKRYTDRYFVFQLQRSLPFQTRPAICSFGRKHLEAVTDRTDFGGKNTAQKSFPVNPGCIKPLKWNPQRVYLYYSSYCFSFFLHYVLHLCFLDFGCLCLWKKEVSLNKKPNKVFTTMEASPPTPPEKMVQVC